MLTVRICSFSYVRDGIPADESGNGGGFVFDCRCLPNPGRLDEFKQVTGLDANVIDYLERAPTVAAFLESAHSMVNLAIASYEDRSFTHLMVSFGCTGGQHRSVYCAESLGDRLVRQGHDVRVQHLGLPGTASRGPQRAL